MSGVNGHFGTLGLLRYGQPKYENWVFAKTQNGRQRFGLASKIFGQKIKVELLEERKNWDMSDKNWASYCTEFSFTFSPPIK